MLEDRTKLHSVLFLVFIAGGRGCLDIFEKVRVLLDFFFRGLKRLCGVGLVCVSKRYQIDQGRSI